MISGGQLFSYLVNQTEGSKQRKDMACLDVHAAIVAILSPNKSTSSQCLALRGWVWRRQGL